jgi:hypothetical protein
MCRPYWPVRHKPGGHPADPKAIEGHDGQRHCTNGARTFTITGSDVFDLRFVRLGLPPSYRLKGYLRKLIQQ